MSYSGRDGKNANSAVIVTVTPEDFGTEDVLSGVAFQQKLEEAAYHAGNGKIPVQLFGDFCKNRASSRGRSDSATDKRGHYMDEHPSDFPGSNCRCFGTGNSDV